MIMKRYSRQGLWLLFLICAFPLHAWTIILAFRDFSWVTERTNSWDAIGVMSYGLIFAFIESLAFFLVVVLLGFFVSDCWKEKLRIALMGNMALVVSLWAMATQLFYLLQVSIPGQVVDFLVRMGHPLRFLYAITLAVVGLTIAFPTYMTMQSDKYLKAVNGFFERLSTLTLFYLFFDFLGLIIVIVRNV